MARVWTVILCFAMLGLTENRLALADSNFGFDSVISKLNFMQDKIEDIEQKIKIRKCNVQSAVAVPNNVDPGARNKLDEIEQKIMAKQDLVQNKLETMNDRLKTMEANMRNIGNGAGVAMPILNIRSCHKEPTKQSGTYFIKLGPKTEPFQVHCEQTAFGGGWIVIQHRSEGKENFYRSWADYREGFGNLNGDFWLGLEHIYQITSSRPYELMVEMRDFNGNYGYAHYDEFLIGNEGSNYYLQKLGNYEGSAGDGMAYNKNVQFSTIDRANSGGTCASTRHGGWWYKYCTYANLNGAYKNTSSDWSSMSWFYFKDDYRGLVFSRMMLREKDALV